MSELLQRPIRTQADLHELWRTLVRPLGWHRRELWFFVIDGDDQPVRQIHQVVDLPADLDEQMTTNLAHVLAGVMDLFPGGRVALLWCRPGSGQVTEADRRNTARAYAALGRAGVLTDVMHLATDDDIVPLPLDELGARSA